MRRLARSLKRKKPGPTIREPDPFAGELFGNGEPNSVTCPRDSKAALAVTLNELIDQRGVTQIEAAHINGMTQPKVSQVRRYKLQSISLERLMRALVSLDRRVEIPKGGKGPGSIDGLA
jgi:predicted XRE-type DNA-binding protein